MVASFQRPGVVIERADRAIAPGTAPGPSPQPLDLDVATSERAGTGATETAGFRTGVAGFIGVAVAGADASLPAVPASQAYTSWHDFARYFREGGGWRRTGWHVDELVWAAVQGFFANGGRRCHVVLYDPASTGDPRIALDHAVAALAAHDDVDLICAPSLLAEAERLPLDKQLEHQLQLQRQLITSCEQARHDHLVDWFLILDGPPPGADLAAWLTKVRDVAGRPADAALYHPWLMPGGEFEPAPGATAVRAVPPSGHMAGIFARVDERVGVHKPPANEEVLGVVDLVGDTADLAGANPLRVFPGRGIRVWGARTLAAAGGSAVPAGWVKPTSDPDGWINVRRLVLTLSRWLVRSLEWVVFETNDFRLWVRIHRELEARLTDLFLRGAFQGKTPDDAFRIKCDEENNPAAARASGRLQIDVQIAPALPQQFVTIRLIRSAEGLTVE